MKRRMGSIFSVLVLLPVIFLAGCLEVEDEYTLNPDGSGKVLHRAWFQNVNLNLTGNEPDPEKQMRDAVQTLLTESEGIEAWKDVQFQLGSDGRIHFSGIAYFSSMNDVKFKHGGISADLLSFSWEPQPDGTAVLGLRSDEGVEDDLAPGVEIDDMEAEMARQRASYLQMKPMMTGMMGGMKARATIRLPAEPASVSNFQQLEDGSVSIALDGEKLIENINAFIMDDERIKEMILEGKSIQDAQEMEGMMAREIFGADGPVRVVVGPGQPLFDYAAEVSAAQAAFPDLLENLGLEGATSQVSLPVDTGEGFTEVRIAGVRWVDDTGSQTARPFNWNPGYTVSVAARLSGRALSVVGGAFEEATTLNGKSLLREQAFDREIRNGRVSDDGQLLIIECQLNDPGEARGIKRVAGKVEYLVAEGEEQIDLGFARLAVGEKGEEAAAMITEIEEKTWGNKTHHIIEMKLKLVPDHLKEVRMLNAAGSLITDIRIQSRMTSGKDDTTLAVRSEEPIPEAGKVLLVKHSNLKQFEVPFEVEDVDLLGRPLEN